MRLLIYYISTKQNSVRVMDRFKLKKKKKRFILFVFCTCAFSTLYPGKNEGDTIARFRSNSPAKVLIKSATVFSFYRFLLIHSSYIIKMVKKVSFSLFDKMYTINMEN